MSLIGGGRITVLGGAKVVQLSSATDSLIVKDVDGFPVFSVDSNGNMKMKGRMSKI